MLVKLVTVFSCLSFCFLPLQAQTLDVVFDLEKPPYIDWQSKTGFEIELVSAIVSKAGFTPLFQQFPQYRHQRVVDEDLADILMTVSARAISDQALLTRPYITYRNVVVSLAARKISLHDVADIKTHRVAAFMNAAAVLGDRYNAAAGASAKYLEVKNQLNQVRLLFDGKVDLLVIDINIFNYYRKLLPVELSQQEVAIHHVFPETPYRLAIKDDQLRQKINAVLMNYRQSAEYAALVQKYQIID